MKSASELPNGNANGEVIFASSPESWMLSHNQPCLLVSLFVCFSAGHLKKPSTSCMTLVVGAEEELGRIFAFNICFGFFLHLCNKVKVMRNKNTLERITHDVRPLRAAGSRLRSGRLECLDEGHRR